MPVEWFPTALRAAIPGASFLALSALERARPLRRETHSKWRRLGVNAGFAFSGGACLGAGYAALVIPAARWGELHAFGALRWLGAPPLARALLSFLLLDYTLWIWHRLNHRLPFLWRFHAAHHVDVELDVSTAIRFHFGELILSAPFRAAQALLLGVDVSVLLAWEAALLVFTQLHHANLRLPYAIERVLRRLIVTPRLHGIHHSVVPREVSSNFGTMLTAWDMLHGTHLWGIPQDRIEIGVPEIRRHEPLLRALGLPFSSRSPPPPDPKSRKSEPHGSD